MAKIFTIEVRVKCKKNGGFSVSVDDWEKKSKVSDAPEYQWELKSIVEGGQDTSKVKWMRIENPFSAANWPFAKTPPDPTYIAYPGVPAKSGPLKGTYVGSGIATRYSITICFEDDTGGAERYAYIDPDMVIDI